MIREKNNSQNESRVIFHILIPVYDREGKPYRRGVYKKIQKVFEEKFGGWNLISDKPTRGGWKNKETEKVEEDLSWRYEVGVLPKSVEEFDKFLSEVAYWMKQKGIWQVKFKGEGKVIEPKKN